MHRGTATFFEEATFSKLLLFKKFDQNFYIKTASSGQHWTRKTIDEWEKASFWGNVIKISI